MFNLDPKPAESRHWLDDTWLNSASRPIKNFGEFDWANVPKLDYAQVMFRQLATPDNAKVLDHADDFVLETFGKVDQIILPPQEEAAIEAKTVEAAEVVPVVVKPAPPKEAVDTSVLFSAESFWSPEESDVLADLAFDEDASPDWDPAAMAAAREEAYAQGHAQGLIDGQVVGQDVGYQQGLVAGQAQAMESAQAQARAELQAEMDTQLAEMKAKLQDQLHLLQNVNDKLRQFSEDPKALFEPLKRLAVHLSEQLVMAELNISGQAIERLVQRCLDELDTHGQSNILVELNPQDKDRLQEMGSEVMGNMHLHAVPTLHPGSVRVIVNDSQIEDLIEHRLQVMANRLLNQPELWREKSAFFRQPLAQRDGDVQDVPQRVALDDASQEDEHD